MAVPAGDPADLLEVLNLRKRLLPPLQRCRQLGFRLLYRSNIDAGADIALKAAVLGLAGRAIVEDPAVLAVSPAQPVFHAERCAPVEMRGVDFKAAVEVLRVDAFGPAVSQFLLDSPAGEGQPRFVEVGAQLVRARRPDHYRRGVHQMAKPRVARVRVHPRHLSKAKPRM